MRQRRSPRALASAVAVAAAMVLSVPSAGASATAAPATASSAQPGTARTAGTDSAAGRQEAAVAEDPAGPAQHPVKDACDKAPKPGWATCFAITRTDVKKHRGLFAATAGRHAPSSARALTAASAAGTAPQGYGPADLQSAYDLPSGTAGTGETVAVVDAYDDPDAEADLQVYRAQYGLPVCDTANGCFRKVSQDGSTTAFPPAPPPYSGWATEISLDLDMVSAVCPNCRILLVEAQDNSDINLGTAVNEAVALGAKYVSNSWGGSEDPSETADDAEYFDHPGTVITAAADDYGYGAAYPATSPDVTAVGGTTLTQDSGSARGWDESAWSGGGSGCSAYEPKPAWQTDTGCANRVEADVSAVADPDTGVAVYDSYDQSGWDVVGGTSAATPIIASVYALAGTPVPGTNPASYPYQDPAALNDVTTGSNGSCSPAYLCTAGPGYDGPTGLGTPDGVAAFASGPQGTVSGTVTDAATGTPVGNAEVGFDGEITHTSAAGGYSLTVPAGTYTLTVEEFGYVTGTVSGVQVTGGRTTRDNVALRPAPSVTLTGHVTDGSGQGWPLYAQVSVPGTPASTYTDPATGAYSLTLPQNATYDVTVDPVYPGYQPADQAVRTGTSDLTQDFSVPVDASTCSALGYQYSYDGTTQAFDGTSAPDGWSVVNAAGTTHGWEFDDPGGLANDTGGSGGFAVADSNYWNTDEDTELISPVLDFSGDSSPYLQFDEDLGEWFGDTIEVDVSTDGGQTWQSVWLGPGFPGKPGPDTESVALPMAAGQSQVQVRFHYVSDDGIWWALDNVFLGNRTCAPQQGGLAEGAVTDGNTGLGVDGATVTAYPSDVSATTSPTPGDPRMNGGFYYMFLPAGSQVLVATHDSYQAGSGTATITDGAVTPQDFTLSAGQLTITPGAVRRSVPLGGTATQQLTFTDSGTLPVSVRLGENAGGYAPPGTPSVARGTAATPASARAGTANVPVRRVTGTFSPLYNLGLAPGAHPNAQAITHPAAGVDHAAAGAASPAGTTADGWTSLPGYPTGIYDNAMATDYSTGIVYSAGGNDGGGSIDTVYSFNPVTSQWTELPPMTYARSGAEAAVVDGKLYVIGGWDIDGDPVPQTEIYDIATATWSLGASEPDAYANGARAVLDGKIYVFGGCDSLICGHDNTQVYDTATGTWSAAASYPVNTAYASCGAIGDEIYCAGGLTSPDSDTANGYVYNPATGAWGATAPLPIDLWGSAYTAANGELLVSGGVTNGGGTLTNQGFAYDPAANAWTDLPDAPTNEFRGGSTCGFIRAGGMNFAYQAFSDVEELPGYTSCATGAPWLSLSQDQFTLQPGASTTVTVTLNAADPAVAQPGSYTAAITVSDDTPYATSPLDVTLDAEPARDMGEITGTVTGLACSGPATPLANATVQVDGRLARYTLTTNASGRYTLWLSAGDDPLMVIAALDGWQPQADPGELVAPGRATTLNFTLSVAPGCQ